MTMSGLEFKFFVFVNLAHMETPAIKKFFLPRQSVKYEIRFYNFVC